jgi:hypothetical protein
LYQGLGGVALLGHVAAILQFMQQPTALNDIAEMFSHPSAVTGRFFFLVALSMNDPLS